MTYLSLVVFEQHLSRVWGVQVPSWCLEQPFACLNAFLPAPTLSVHLSIQNMCGNSRIPSVVSVRLLHVPMVWGQSSWGQLCEIVCTFICAREHGNLPRHQPMLNPLLWLSAMMYCDSPQDLTMEESWVLWPVLLRQRRETGGYNRKKNGLCKISKAASELQLVTVITDKISLGMQTDKRAYNSCNSRSYSRTL